MSTAAPATEVRRALPPNYPRICEALGVPPSGAVFAYDWVIYAPHSAKLGPDLIAHETVHFFQQANVGGADAWWEQYLADPFFRCQQEVEAYRVQLSCFPDRKSRRRMLQRFAKDLSGPMYRLPISQAQARELIQHGRMAQMAVPK